VESPLVAAGDRVASSRARRRGFFLALRKRRIHHHSWSREQLSQSGNLHLVKGPNTEYSGEENRSSEGALPIPGFEGRRAPSSAERNPALPPPDRAQWFATTHWSVVLAARQAPSPEAEAALEALCRNYWYPLYAYVRRQGNPPHDAQDLTQAFFARLFEKDYLASVAPEKGKFRSFLLAALNHFLSNERARTQAARRGGGRPVISLDATDEESRYALEPVAPGSPESAFDRNWAVTLLERAFGTVREEFEKSGKGILFDKLKPFLAEGVSTGDYSTAAKELNLSANAVAVSVHRLRQKYREAVRAEVAQTVANPDQMDEEMQHLFAALTT
jgi:RNA polymerase sigma-70 factor (ECF subfamily)